MISVALIDAWCISFEGLIAISSAIIIIIIGILIGLLFEDPFGISVLVSVGVSCSICDIG